MMIMGYISTKNKTIIGISSYIQLSVATTGMEEKLDKGTDNLAVTQLISEQSQEQFSCIELEIMVMIVIENYHMDTANSMIRIIAGMSESY